MLKIQKATNQEKPGTFKKLIPRVIDDKLHHLAFLNSLQPTFIVAVSSKKVITDNMAFSKLPGLFRKGIINKKRAAVFNINLKAHRTRNIIS